MAVRRHFLKETDSLSAQFHMYFQIIDGGYALEEARTMMQAAAIDHTGGWLALLAGENREREDSHEV